ncbi:hypothetical protein JSE7799_03143 [Jannaschia seosinensis]|uniref:Uncharacterized protein n=1 Tax=Jannaschia seosinensis TaxID=313367 RepID=A0A0M7BDD7_9RHOB|nr:hypothetical protein JSE7799_03143 [Jannaschia seosinensis]
MLSALLLTLGACAVPVEQVGVGPSGFIEDLPERVVELAAPDQDLETVRLMREDGCYWYQYVGPVETTMLPLRTTDGKPICNRRAGAAPVAA